jgi:hypothetical protein
MASQTQIAVFLNQLAAWFSGHPVIVRLVIITAVVLTAIMFSYSVVHAMPLIGGGGGCGC